MIAEARADLAALLTTAGFNVSAYVPNRATPPIAILEPATDWVESGDTPYSFRIGFNVTMITPTASNEKASDEIDQMVDDVLDVISDAVGYYCGSVSNPGAVDANGVDYLGVTFTVYQNKQL